jgi:ubiquinone/menaquinone biosynthesis C-methylase UbiE
MSNTAISDSVKNYYGEVLKNSSDLKTSACCPIDAMPRYLLPLLKKVHTEVKDKFYGCGSPLPFGLQGKTVLDLGCGTGRDVYLAAQLVGEKGRVIGIDMTEQQLEVARSHIDYHQQQFGYAKNNVEFHHAYIEDLSTANIADASVDVVISNCVINLSANKKAVFKEIFRVLKPGGELYFSDVFADRRIPEALKTDAVLLGECLGGAMYTEDFRRVLNTLGCLDIRAMSKSLIVLDDEEIVQKVGMINFYSMTMRTFKCDFEDQCEDFGHVAFYQGTIKETPHQFVLDDHHVFKTGMPVPICGNTAKMLVETHYAPHFKVIGDFSTHYGLFDCAPSDDKAAGGACC